MMPPPHGDSEQASELRRFELPRIRRVLEGPAALQDVGAELDAAGGERTLLVTSRTVGALPEVTSLRAALEDRVALTFDGVQPHNPSELIGELVEFAVAGQVDSIVAVGGGSVMDAAKLVSLAVGGGVNRVERLLDPGQRPSADTGSMPYIIAAPTTLSAAEWNGSAGLTRDGVKTVVRDLSMVPRTVVLDPTLCQRTPRDLWLTSGIRAIDHAVETLYSSSRHAWSTGLACHALELLARYLTDTGQDAQDTTATLACQHAAGMSISSAYNVALGLSHAIGHQLGAAGVPHGVTSCLVLPHVMRFFAPQAPERDAQIAEAMCRGLDITNGGPAADIVEMVLDRIDAPRRIRDFGLDREQLDAVAAATMTAQRALDAAPRAVDYDDVCQLLQQAY